VGDVQADYSLVWLSGLSATQFPLRHPPDVILNVLLATVFLGEFIWNC
jgi:hypothetical protein